MKISIEEDKGGVLGDKNPLMVGYNSVHFESLETISHQDELRAIELAQLIKSGQYELNNSHVQKMTQMIQNNNKQAMKKGLQIRLKKWKKYTKPQQKKKE